MTYSEQFVKDNVIIENDKNGNPRRAYILCRNWAAAKSSYVQKHLNRGIVRKYKVDVEHGIISFEAHVRFARALEKAGDNIPRLYILLNQMFTENSIRLFWYDVWLSHHNIQVRKSNTTARQHFVRDLRRGLIKPVYKAHKECVEVTKNMTIRRAAETYNNF